MSEASAIAPLPETDEFPRPFGAYLLLGGYARGGMGEVYLAKTGGIAGIEKFCVLKKLRPDLSADPEYVKRFIDEARVVVTLNHSNIAQVFDVGRVGRDHYLAMEHVSGLNLRQICDRAKARSLALPLSVALQVTAELLEGLDYAHRRRHPTTGEPLRLVHRDISPHNVMVSFEGEVKIIDFGLAASELKEEQTESQVVMGKVAYMSPEQARGEKLDARCDQFAAAICLYELAAGERYYADMPTHEIWQHVGTGRYVAPKLASLDEGLREVLKRALAGEPADRYPTCGDFKEAVLKYAVDRSPGLSRKPVRTLLETLCGDDMESDRAFLARFAHVSASKVREQTEQTARGAVRLVETGVEMTMTSSSKSSPAAGGSGPTSPTGTGMAPFGYDAPTEATLTSSKARLPAVTPPTQQAVTARRMLIGAAALLGVSLLVIGLFVTRDPPPAQPPPVLVDATPTAVPLTPLPMPSPIPPPTPAADPSQAPTTAPLPAPPPIPPPPTPPPKAKSAPKVPTPTKAPLAPAPASVPAPTPAAPTPAAPATFNTLDDRVARIQQCKLPCASPLTRAAAAEASRDNAHLRQFKTALAACESECAAAK